VPRREQDVAEKSALDAAIREFAEKLADVKERTAQVQKLESGVRGVESLRAKSLAESQFLVVG